MSSHVTYDDVLARAEMRTQDTNAAFVITSDNVRDYQAPFAASHRDAAVSRAKKTHPSDAIQSDSVPIRCVKRRTSAKVYNCAYNPE